MNPLVSISLFLLGNKTPKKEKKMFCLGAEIDICNHSYKIDVTEDPSLSFFLVW